MMCGEATCEVRISIGIMSHTISIHPFRPTDLAETVGLLRRELHADPISAEEFRRKVLQDENHSPEGALVAGDGDRIVGFMLALVRKHPLEDAPPDLDRGWITLMAVDSEYQRCGTGSRLLEEAMAYLGRRGARSVWVSPYAPNYFCPGVDEAAYPGAIEFLRKHGFEVVARPLAMEASLADLDVDGASGEHLPADGTSITGFRWEHEAALLGLLKREFPGDWQRVVRQSLIEAGKGTLATDELLLAMRNGRCVGFCRHEGERFGPFGVAASERGRGVGAVLLARCLRNMREKGLRRAWFMWTEDRAARLYSRAGFRETRRFSVMRRNL